MTDAKELRYYVMLALYFPILLYAFSTFDLNPDVFVAQDLEPVLVGEPTVMLGQEYHARAFLAVADEKELVAAGDLEVLGDSMFVMRTGALLAGNEQSKQIAYEGSFRFKRLDGSNAEIPLAGSFTVRRPEIVATSEATQTLYRQCLNQIRIDVPGLENRELKLDAGGRAVEGRSITLSPTGSEAVVRVSVRDEAGDIYLGSKRFAVIDPPRPEIRINSAGREIRNGDNLPRARAMIEFNVVPDQEFARRFPNDARYRVGRAVVHVRRGLAASEELGRFDVQNNTIVLTSALRNTQPGDRIMVQLEDIYRISHSGQTVRVPFHSGSLTFGFVLS